MWDADCHKDNFSWEHEAEHCLDEPYVALYGQLRVASHLGFRHGDDFWDPQHNQKLSVGQLVAAIGHVVQDKYPQHFGQMATIIKRAHPGVSALWFPWWSPVRPRRR